MAAVEYLQKHYDEGGIKKVLSQLKDDLYFTWNAPGNSYDVKYIETKNRNWTPWGRSLRNFTFTVIDDKVYCVRHGLRRGAEVLTPAHFDVESQDYKPSSVSRLDRYQQDIVKTLQTKDPLHGYLVEKVDGSLLCFTFYPKDSVTWEWANSLRNQFTPTIDAMNIGEAIVLPSSSGRFFRLHNENLLMRQLGIQKLNSQIWSCYKNALEEGERRMLDLTEPITLSFEFTSPSDLNCVIYSKMYFSFLGATFQIQSDPVFLPHLLIAPEYGPNWQEIHHANDVVDALERLTAVVNANKDDDVHAEGFVLYTERDSGYDLAKVKTQEYYLAHKGDTVKLSLLPPSASSWFRPASVMAIQMPKLLARFKTLHAAGRLGNFKPAAEKIEAAEDQVAELARHPKLIKSLRKSCPP